MKTHWKQLVNPNYIGAYSLPDGKDLNVIIDKVVREQVTGDGGRKEECTVAYLKGQKPFIVNRTNAKTITKVIGTPYIEEWAGKTITLFVTSTSLKGEQVECLRVRPEVAKKPKLEASTELFSKIKTTIENGTYTIEQWKNKYEISKEVEQLLTTK